MVVGLNCPCGRGRPYSACCGALHQRFALDGILTAPDAEALMRSRYSAFVRDLRDYLMATWHPSTRPPQLEAAPADLRWLGLEVLAHQATDATHATVHFVARSKRAGRAHRHVETSRFVCEQGHWLYLDAL